MCVCVWWGWGGSGPDRYHIRYGCVRSTHKPEPDPPPHLTPPLPPLAATPDQVFFYLYKALSLYQDYNVLSLGQMQVGRAGQMVVGLTGEEVGPGRWA